MVWQETVNLPTYVKTGSIPVIYTKFVAVVVTGLDKFVFADQKGATPSATVIFRSVRIEVITVDCLSIYGGSIPPQTAKFM